MSYAQFESALFVALVDAASANNRWQVDVFPVADSLLPAVQEQWVFNAVTSYEGEELVFNVSRSLGPPRDGGGGIVLMITGKGQRTADAMKAQIAAAQQPPRKIGY
jgi:hypothetical protein